MKILFTLLVASICFLGCGDDNNEDQLFLNFKLEYQDQPLVLFEEVDYPDGKKIEFTRVSFYLSEIELTVDGQSFNAGETYVDLTASHSELNTAQEGLNVGLKDVTGNVIENIKFNVGLTPEQNSTVPQDYPSSSALSRSGEYWSNWNSYVFVKLEGRYDRDGDGIKEGFALHLGSDSAMRSVNFNDLNGNDIAEVKIDVEKIFNNGTLYNISENPNLHSLSQMDQINQLMDNLASSISIR